MFSELLEPKPSFSFGGGGDSRICHLHLWLLYCFWSLVVWIVEALVTGATVTTSNLAVVAASVPTCSVNRSNLTQQYLFYYPLYSNYHLLSFWLQFSLFILTLCCELFPHAAKKWNGREIQNGRHAICFNHCDLYQKIFWEARLYLFPNVLLLEIFLFYCFTLLFPSKPFPVLLEVICCAWTRNSPFQYVSSLIYKGLLSQGMFYLHIFESARIVMLDNVDVKEIRNKIYLILNVDIVLQQ